MPVPFHLRRMSVFVATLAFLVAALGSRAAADTPPSIVSFTLVDAATDQPIDGYDPIPEDGVIDLDALPDELNIRANANDDVRSIRFDLDGDRFNLENREPYAFAGDLVGDYKPWTPETGTTTIEATPFGRHGARGERGETVTLELAFTRSGEEEPTAERPTVSAAGTPDASTAPVAQDADRCGPIPAAPVGWQRRVTSTFDEQTPLGQWPGPVASRDWRGRDAGTDSSGRGRYSTDKTISEHDGLLDVWIHSEGGQRYVAAPIPLIGDTVGQRITVCMRADRIPGYKIAFLLWPDSGEGNSRGEIDFPEGKLTPTGEAHAFMHYDPEPSSGKKQDAYASGVSTVDWHAYTIEWHPGRDVTSFYVDGELIGRSVGPEVPDGPMHYVMQMETYLKGQPLPPPAEGHVLVDWVTIDLPGSDGVKDPIRP